MLNRDQFRKILFSFILLFVLEEVAFAQVPELINDPEFRPVAQAAVDSVYNFNFEGAEDILVSWKKRYPDHPLWMLIDGMELWWQVLSDLEDTSHDEEFFYRMKRVDYEASKLLRQNSSHADGLIIKTVSNGYIARQYANRDEWLSSISRARKALSAHGYLIELQPDLADLKLAEGLKFYYAAYLPEAYPVVKTVSWFLPDGDKQKGLQLMQEAADHAIFASAEATYFLGNINYNYQEDYDEAVRHFEALYARYPNNNYYVRKLVSSLYRIRRYSDALDVIDESIRRWEQHHLAFKEVLHEELYTWKGRILNRQGDTSEAMAYFRKAFEAGEELPRTRYRSFHVAAGYYLGKLLHEEGESSEARKYLQEVLACKTGDQYRGRAKKLLENIN